ncbi:MAG: trimethylamine methyltransferase family protein [Planctomycetota bacterium]
MTDDAGAIHQASLDLLENPGVRVEHDEIVSRLKARGAKTSGGRVVRFPPEMVMEHLALCPREVVLADRRGGKAVLSAESEPVFWACPGMYWYHKGERRLFTSRDMAALTRVLDQLEHVQAVFGMALDDIPPPVRDVVGLHIMARNTTKHIRALCFSAQGARILAEMKAVVGDTPWFSVGFTAHGPLRWTNLALEVFKQTAGYGIPATVNGEPMAGVSGPVTLAGAAAVGNAEILAGLVINQVLEPGRPCIHNLGLAHVFDMRTAIAVTGGPENALLAQIAGMMGRFYGLPSASWVSTESMCPDAQAALEKMFGFHSHMQSGVSCVWGVSQLESELTVSPEQAVIDNEMIAYARRYRRGYAVGEETLALEVIRETGIAGSFLDREHTLDHFRSELFMPGLLFRKRWSDWEEKGHRRLEERAADEAAVLMRNDVPNGLSDEQIEALSRFAARAVAAA